MRQSIFVSTHSINRDKVFALIFMNMFMLEAININKSGNLQGVVVNLLDCDIEVNEFDIKLHYYILFRTNALAKESTPYP